MTVPATAIRLALTAGVAALAGCSSTPESSNVELEGGITQAVARGFTPGPNGTTTVNLANARNGERVVLNVNDGVPAANGSPAVIGSATLAGVGSTATPALALNEIGDTTLAPGAAGNPYGTEVRTRTYGTASETSAPQPGTDSLVVIDAEYARLAYGTLAPTEANGNQSGVTYAFGPNAGDTPREVPTSGTATYTGGARVSQIQPGGTQVAEGDVTLNADFGRATIEGQIDLDNDTRVVLREGTIDGPRYNGTVAIVDATGARTFAPDTAGDNGRAAFRGGFYGPDADETAGVVDFKGTVRTDGGTERFDATGNYLATKGAAAPATP